MHGGSGNMWRSPRGQTHERFAGRVLRDFRRGKYLSQASRDKGAFWEQQATVSPKVWGPEEGCSSENLVALLPYVGAGPDRGWCAHTEAKLLDSGASSEGLSYLDRQCWVWDVGKAALSSLRSSWKCPLCPPVMGLPFLD